VTNTLLLNSGAATRKNPKWDAFWDTIQNRQSKLQNRPMAHPHRQKSTVQTSDASHSSVHRPVPRPQAKANPTSVSFSQPVSPETILQRLEQCPSSLTPAETIQLQHQPGNRAVVPLIDTARQQPFVANHRTPIQRQPMFQGPIFRGLSHELKRELGQSPKPNPPQPSQPTSPPEPESQASAAAAAPIQRAAATTDASSPTVEGSPLNCTGLPDGLKAGVENLSGFSMDDVRVRYNSDKPAQLNALAYTQGSEIHVAPGQERHLPHEAWHVVQQKQGRVKPTLQAKGVPINDDRELEQEADVMGARANGSTQVAGSLPRKHASTDRPATLQAVWTEHQGKGAWIWDEAIDGLAWFKDDKGAMWYQIVEEKLDSKHSNSNNIGPNVKHDYKTWMQLHSQQQAPKPPDILPEEAKKLINNEYQQVNNPPEYLYKAVTRFRLQQDLKMENLPIGVRQGSATMLAISSREPTPLDAVTLWFGTKNTAKDYATGILNGKDAILLQVNVRGMTLFSADNSSFFTTDNIAWTRVKYLTTDGVWKSLPQDKKAPNDYEDFDDDA